MNVASSEVLRLDPPATTIHDTGFLKYFESSSTFDRQKGFDKEIF